MTSGWKAVIQLWCNSKKYSIVGEYTECAMALTLLCLGQVVVSSSDVFWGEWSSELWFLGILVCST